MAASSTSVLKLTVTAGASLTAGRAVNVAGTVPAGAANSLGIVDTDAASGDNVAVTVLGTAIATAGAPITAGALLEVGTAGKLVTRSAGAIVGRALTAAGADNDQIEVLLIAN
jgi:hypothetical protein